MKKDWTDALTSCIDDQQNLYELAIFSLIVHIVSLFPREGTNVAPLLFSESLQSKKFRECFETWNLIKSNLSLLVVPWFIELNEGGYHVITLIDFIEKKAVLLDVQNSSMIMDIISHSLSSFLSNSFDIY